MTKPKVPKPNTASKADVKSHQRSLNKLQRQMIRANKRNSSRLDELAATQQESFDNTAEQLTIVQQAAVEAAKEPEAVDESVITGLMNAGKAAAQAQSDSIQSRATADLRARSQIADYERTLLSRTLARNKQAASGSNYGRRY